MSTTAESLRDVPLFADLSRRDLKRLAESMQELSFPAGKEVVAEGRRRVLRRPRRRRAGHAGRRGSRPADGRRVLRRDGADRRRAPDGIRPRRGRPALRCHVAVDVPPVRQGPSGHRLGAVNRAGQARARGAGTRRRCGWMIGTVAVGTDGSETAAKAVSAALELAERYGAALVVLSAFNGRSGAPAAPRLAPPAHPEWASNAAEQVERILAAAEESAA